MWVMISYTELDEEWGPRYGYRRLHVLLQRRGHEVNVKRVYRLYLEERLAVRRRKRKRLVRDRALAPRLIRPHSSRPSRRNPQSPEAQ